MRVPPSFPVVLALVAASALAGCVSGPGSSEDALVRVSGGPWSQPSAVQPGTYSVFPGDYNFDGPGSFPLVRGPYEALPMEHLYLDSDLDGAAIDIAIWRPDVPDGVKVPVVVQASPYFSSTQTPAGSQNIGGFMVHEILPHGYAYVQLAIRSTANSGGCDDFRGPKMTHDIDQAVNWLAGQPWSNGNVGLIGKSYPGSTPWYVAGTGNPNIKTVVPVSGSTNAWEVYNRNGTPESRAAMIVPNYGISALSNSNRDPDKRVESVACAEVFYAWVAGVSSGLTGERVPAGFWDERNAKPKVEANYGGSVLLVHGLQDWNVDPAVALPWADHLNRTGVPVKQMLGQWGHDYPDWGPDWTMRYDWAEILLRWFDHYLKDAPVDTGPWVQVQDDQGRWRDEVSWPPRDAEWQVYHLTGDGRLDEEPGSAASWRLVRSAPGGADGALGTQRVDFRLGPVERDLHIAGLPKVHVTVVPDGPGGTIGAFLYTEDPASGALKRTGWTAMNLRFAAGGHDAQPVVPGEPVVARMEIQPMDAVVPAGHTLVLRLWINVPSDRIVPPPGTPVTLHVGSSVHSVLELPVVDRPEAAFFTPPMPIPEAS